MSDRLVNMEIEAAEALAGLAYSVSRGDHRSTDRLSTPPAAASSDTAVSMLLSSGKDGAPPIVEQHYLNEEARITNGRSWEIPIRSAMSICSRHHRVTSGDPSSTVQNRGLPNGPCWSPYPYGHRCHFLHSLTDQERLLGPLPFN